MTLFDSRSDVVAGSERGRIAYHPTVGTDGERPPSPHGPDGVVRRHQEASGVEGTVGSIEGGNRSLVEPGGGLVEVAGRSIGGARGAAGQSVAAQCERRLGPADRDPGVPFQRGRPGAELVVDLGQPVQGGRADAVPCQVGSDRGGR